MVRERLGVETLYAATLVVGADFHCPGWGLLATAGLTENRFLPHLGHEAQGWGKSIVSSPYGAETAAGPDRGGERPRSRHPAGWAQSGMPGSKNPHFPLQRESVSLCSAQSE